MRNFQEISDDLNKAISLVNEKQVKLNNANIEADEMIKSAEALRANASAAYNEAKVKAVELMTEHENLMVSIFGDATGRVRQSR